MPIYEYICSACDHRADILHGLHDPGPTFCPSCGSEGTMRKAIATPTIIYKGSGWAKKDRRATSSPRASTADHRSGGSDKKSESSAAESSSGRESSSTDGGGDSADGDSAGGDGARANAKAGSGTATSASKGGDD
jgi:putative FmdB family regulatory protein